MEDLVILDSHQYDSGARVHYDSWSKLVYVYRYGELCEPDENGDYHAHIHHNAFPLLDCYKAGKAERYHNDSQILRVARGALYLLSERGGAEHVLRYSGATPCELFGRYAHRFYGDRTASECTCGVQATNDPGEARAYPPA